MRNNEDAVKASKALHGKVFGGRPIEVNLATPRKYVLKPKPFVIADFFATLAKLIV